MSVIRNYPMKASIIYVFLFSITSTLFIRCNPGTTNNPPVIDSIRIKAFAVSFHEGQQLFIQHCTPCHRQPEHRITCDYIFTNLFERLPKPAEDYFVRFIRDSKALKEAGNDYTITTSREYNSNYNHHFKDALTEDDFDRLLIYMKAAIKLK